MISKVFNEEDIELAERYESALSEIKKLLDEISNFDEEDVILAERYLQALKGIKEIEDEN